jgi:UDP-N-acetylbacillosamine N-acetyltransferase
MTADVQTHATRGPVQTEKIAVFGFKDALVGQLIQFLNAETAYEIAYFISTKALPDLDIEKEHDKRPNRKTEFVRDGKIFGKPVFTTSEYIEKLRADGIKKALLLEDDLQRRKEIFADLKRAGVQLVTYVHPSAFLGEQVTIGEGTVIFPRCYIGYKSDIGDGTIMQSNCTIEHHNRIGNFCDINPNLTTGGFTLIDDLVEINISVDIVNQISVGAGSRIGAGSLVLSDCEPGFLYYGRPARQIRPHGVQG